MNPENVILVDKISELFPFIIAVVAISVAAGCSRPGSGSRTDIRWKPAWGRAIHPHTDKEAIERIKLLTNENAQLRAELGSSRTGWRRSSGSSPTSRPLAREIEALAIDKGVTHDWAG
jgi:hypothetical protein